MLMSVMYLISNACWLSCLRVVKHEYSIGTTFFFDNFISKSLYIEFFLAQVRNLIIKNKEKEITAVCQHHTTNTKKKNEQ